MGVLGVKNLPEIYISYSMRASFPTNLLIINRMRLFLNKITKTYTVQSTVLCIFLYQHTQKKERRNYRESNLRARKLTAKYLKLLYL